MLNSSSYGSIQKSPFSKATAFFFRAERTYCTRARKNGENAADAFFQQAIFGIADILYRQVDKLTDYQIHIISLIHVPMVDQFGSFALDDMTNHAQKNGTKVLIKGMNPAVRRTLNELSVMAHIVEENFVENFDAALKEGIDYIGEQFLGRNIPPKTV